MSTTNSASPFRFHHHCLPSIFRKNHYSTQGKLLRTRPTKPPLSLGSTGWFWARAKGDHATKTLETCPLLTQNGFSMMMMMAMMMIGPSRKRTAHPKSMSERSAVFLLPLGHSVELCTPGSSAATTVARRHRPEWRGRRRREGRGCNHQLIICSHRNPFSTWRCQFLYAHTLSVFEHGLRHALSVGHAAQTSSP